MRAETRSSCVVAVVCGVVAVVVVWLGLDLRNRGEAIDVLEARAGALEAEIGSADAVVLEVGDAAEVAAGAGGAEEPVGGITVERVAVEMGGVVARVVGLREKYFGDDETMPTLEELVESMRGVGAIAVENPELYADLVAEWELVMRGAMGTVMKATTTSLMTPETGREEDPEVVAEGGAEVLAAFYGEALGLGRKETAAVGRILREGRRKVIVDGADAGVESQRMWSELEAAMGEVPFAVLGELVQGLEILGDPVGGAELLTGIGSKMVDELLGDLGG